MVKVEYSVKKQDYKNRLQQEEEEKIVHQYLANEFYSGGTMFTVTNVDEQIKGNDCFYITDTSGYTIDEKAFVTYINIDIPTVALELSIINRGDKTQDGWFLNGSNTNNSYVFTNIVSATTLDLRSVEDIIETKTFLITKKAIYDYLASMGWNKDKLKAKCKRIWDNPNEPLERTNYDAHNKQDYLKFQRISHVDKQGHVEKSIILKLRRDKLIKHADIVL